MYEWGKKDTNAPFTLIIDHKLEHAMSVWGAESNRIFACFAGNGRERRTDVRIEHRELELQITEPRIRFPLRRVRVVLGNMRRENLALKG